MNLVLGSSAASLRSFSSASVLGATAPEHIARARELMPRATFLLPGVGAQGGRIEELAPGKGALVWIMLRRGLLG